MRNANATDAEWLGRYADLSLTPLELQAIQWLDGFYQLEHLLVTRQWVRRLRADASPALLFAALVHDAERHFPGAVPSTPDVAFDDPDYLFAHSTRSADVVEKFLRDDAQTNDEAFVYQVRTLVLRHELGGSAESDVLQAADSLSFLETLSWLTAEWVTSGTYSKERSVEKLRWSIARIRIHDAIVVGLPLYDRAVRELDTTSTLDSARRRRIAGDSRLLLGFKNESSREPE